MVVSVTIVGAGLVGSLASIYSSSKGWKVVVIEKRPDFKVRRSINLALSERGIHSLSKVKIEQKILKRSIPMTGRMIHPINKNPFEQPYGLHGETINSVDRNLLNIQLIEEAEKSPNVTFHFNCDIQSIDIDTGKISFTKKFDYSQKYIHCGYKEITLFSGPNEEPLLSNKHLHIWSRSEFMMIALPNENGSFTCTLFFPFTLFDVLSESSNNLLKFYKIHFPDFLNLIGNERLIKEYESHPVGSLITIVCSPYHYKDKIVLLGDAIHAMVPFYGQGMNAGFEDVRILFDLITENNENRLNAFETFSKTRYLDAISICDLAIENYYEMSSLVLSKWFQLKKKILNGLYYLYPRMFIPQYSMISFTGIPYSQVVKKRNMQNYMLYSILISIVWIVIFLFLFHNKLK